MAVAEAGAAAVAIGLGAAAEDIGPIWVDTMLNLGFGKMLNNLNGCGYLIYIYI